MAEKLSPRAQADFEQPAVKWPATSSQAVASAARASERVLPPAANHRPITAEVPGYERPMAYREPGSFQRAVARSSTIWDVTRTAACCSRGPAARGGRSSIRNSSIPRAACRPSAIAQTIRLWPRVMSPAVKTLGIFVRLVRVGLDVFSPVELDAELFEQAVLLGPDEAHRQQDKIRRINPLGARNLHELEPAVVRLHLNLDRLECADAAVLAQEPPGVDRVFANSPLLMRRGDAEDVRPLRPGIVGAARPAGAGRSRTDGRSCSPGGAPCPGSRRRCRRRR